jgi:hypothetical protein
MAGDWGGGGIGVALLLLDLGARWRWVASTTPRPMYPRERPGTHWTGGWLDVCEKSRPHQDSISGPSSQALYRLSYLGPCKQVQVYNDNKTKYTLCFLRFSNTVSISDGTTYLHCLRQNSGEAIFTCVWRKNEVLEIISYSIERLLLLCIQHS